MPIAARIRKNLARAKRVALENGCGLLEDANILFENSRLPRAGSLAILAIEEFAKVVILNHALLSDRWDEEIRSLFMSHGKKQAIAIGSIEAAQYLLRVGKDNQNRIVPIPHDIHKAIGDIKGLAIKNYVKKEKLDKQKQNFQFVNIDQYGMCRIPFDGYDNTGIVNILNLAQKVKFSVNAAAFGINVDECPLFRSCTSINWDSSGLNTIRHSDGFDVCIDPLELIRRKGPCKLITKDEAIAFYDFVEHYKRQAQEAREDFLSRRNDAATIIKDYDVIEQISRQLDWLDIKQSSFYESCIEIVKASD
ncbi:MAG: AbiV family abortive infection protein [Desulfovibrio sp.]|jgi:AbiV family abortive infection protein